MRERDEHGLHTVYFRVKKSGVLPKKNGVRTKGSGWCEKGERGVKSRRGNREEQSLSTVRGRITLIDRYWSSSGSSRIHQ